MYVEIRGKGTTTTDNRKRKKKKLRIGTIESGKIRRERKQKSFSNPNITKVTERQYPGWNREEEKPWRRTHTYTQKCKYSSTRKNNK